MPHCAIYGLESGLDLNFRLGIQIINETLTTDQKRYLSFFFTSLTKLLTKPTKIEIFLQNKMLYI